jgi:hypothetical protein
MANSKKTPGKKTSNKSGMKKGIGGKLFPVSGKPKASKGAAKEATKKPAKKR